MPPTHLTNPQYSDSKLCHRAPRFVCLQCADNRAQVFEARGHVFRRYYGRIAEFHVLLDHAPAGIAIAGERSEEMGEVDVALADDSKDLVLDCLLEAPMIAARLLQHG